MRRLPKTLRFLGQRFNVEVKEGLIHDNEDVTDHDQFHMAYGVYTPQVNTIYLHADNGRNRMQVTLMHEALHAMLDASHITVPHEEDVVGILAPLLVDFIRGNKAAVAYLQEV